MDQPTVFTRCGECCNFVFFPSITLFKLAFPPKFLIAKCSLHCCCKAIFHLEFLLEKKYQQRKLSKVHFLTLTISPCSSSLARDVSPGGVSGRQGARKAGCVFRQGFQ